MSKTTALRRGAAGLAAVTVALATLTACTGGGGGNSAAALTIATNTSTYPKNFNFLAPTNSGNTPGIDLVYEPLVTASPSDGWTTAPWLADAWEWNPEGTQLTFTLHPGVTWSDGTAFTSADVKATLDLLIEYPAVSKAAIGDIKSVDAPDDLTVNIHYDVASFGTLSAFRNVLILPKSVWEGKDPTTFVPTEPMGTGPFTLKRFAPQQVTYTMRDDYWNGKSKGVEDVVYRALPSADTVLQELLTGKVDYAVSTLVGNPAETFVAKDPKVNHYWLPAPGAGQAMVMNNAIAPTDDVHIRQALNAAIDRSALIKLDPATSGSASNITGVNEPVYADWVAPEFKGVTADIDVDKAKSELDASGYTVKDGVLTKGGKEYPLEILTAPGTNVGDGIAQSIKDVLGIDVTVTQLEGAGDKVAAGEYTLAASMPDTPGLGSPPNIAWNVGAPAPVGEVASNNWARFDSAEARDLAAQLIAESDVEKQKQLVFQLERIIVAQRPTAPLTPYAWTLAYTERNWTGWPDEKNPEMIPEAGRSDLIKTILALTPAS